MVARSNAQDLRYTPYHWCIMPASSIGVAPVTGIGAQVVEYRLLHTNVPLSGYLEDVETSVHL
jgi:hypothetical protein